ncbi:MAG TPA: SAF domain-containing protein [Mycobacteriales bacterium]|jgi:hypothetical protein|nr:SAF domain-containing protein [Mycobacteriales bacterium]
MGVLLIAVSVTAGARLAAAADRSVQVWSLTRDVGAGTVLIASDMRPARVRLFDTGPLYLHTADSPAGRSVSRPLSDGELLPAAALTDAGPAAIVAVPVQPQNAPALARGQAVDVWATVKGCPPERVLAGVPIQDVRAERAGSLSVAGGSVQVVLRVGPAEAARLVSALGAEAVIRLVVLDGGRGEGAASLQRGRCGPSSGPTVASGGS